MLSINNRALPIPSELEVSLKEPLPGSYLSSLCLRAVWPGQSEAGMAYILQDTAQSFTLACFDPRTGLERGFTARLTACRAAALGGGLYRLEILIEETE